jgi:CelD/BcsL family acetyltransferase involved in cellulose biosynthesis
LLLDQLELHENSIMRYRTFKRAVLEGVDSFDEYLSVLPAKRRQDYRRNRRRLEAAGDVQIDCRVIDDVKSDFADRFAMMERRSWKGEHSTALACSESAHAFLKSITENFAARRAFYACEIVLNGRSISMSHNLLGTETMFAFKIAFDAESRTYSPGIQLAIETVRSLFDDGIEKADGGNAEDSFMSQLWPRQLQFENVFMPVSLSSRLFAKMADQAASFQHRNIRIASSTGA